MSRAADPVHSNAQIFRVYLRRLSNPADQDIFITSAKKLAVFLSSERAYYAEARQPVIELLEVSLNSLKNVAPDVFRESASMDRSLIPAEQAPLFDAFDKLANSVTPYVPLFTDESLSNRLLLLLSSVGIALSPGTQDVESPDVSTQTSAPHSAGSQVVPMASQAIAPTRDTPQIANNTGPSASVTPELTPTGGSATPTQAPAQVPDSPLMTVESPPASGLEEATSTAFDEVTVDHEVASTPTQQTPASVLPRQSPLSHGPATLSTAPIEPNLPPQALPPPSASLPSMPTTLPLLHSQSLLPVFVPQVAPIPVQKIAPSPSVGRIDVPASAPSTNFPQGPKLQSSKSPTLDGAVQAPQIVFSSLARAHASGSAPVSVSSPSIQQNPKPPSRRQSSGLDFLQLDLQVARERKQRAAAEAVRSGSVAHISSPTSSISGGVTPAAAVATSIPVVIPGTPVQSLFSPTTPVVAQGTPALMSPIQRTPLVDSPTTISNESDDLSALQPQKAQTAASRPIHRDLRQRSSRSGSGTPSTPRLQITDRAPPPPPEPGSLAAPIVIDEDEEEPISVPIDEKMEVDTPVDVLPNGEAKSVMVLDLQDSRGDEESVEEHPKSHLQQEENVTSKRSTKQEVSAPHSTPHVPVPEAELPAPGSEMQGVSPQQASESKGAPGNNCSKDLLTADVDMVVAERKTTTATLTRDGERGTMNSSAECPIVAVVSGTTIEQPGNTETAPIAPASKAATTEASPMPMPSSEELIKALLSVISSESGPGIGSQPHPNPATEEHADGAPVADVLPVAGTGKHPRSPTPNGDRRRVIPRKLSPAPIAEQRQDLPATPVLSNIAPVTIPTLTVSHVAQQRENEGSSVGIVGPSSTHGPSVHQPLTPGGSGRASTNLSFGFLRTSSFSDMDISRSSTPPIVALKNPSESASGTNSPNSGSASPPRTDDDEMVDELAPLFGKEMRVLAMVKTYDIPGKFTLDCSLVNADWDKISVWVRAPANIDLDISQARCISLACYSVQDLQPHANEQDVNREHWFENARPVPWPKIPRHLWFLVNDEFTLLYPPYEAEEELFDLSQYLRPGPNKITFTQIDSMADYVLVLHGHYPTRKQTTSVRVRWDEKKRFREQLAWLARPISPTI